MLCLPGPAAGRARALWALPLTGFGVATEVDAVTAQWDVTVDEAAPVDALAIAADPGPARTGGASPTAVPMSGRLIRTSSPKDQAPIMAEPGTGAAAARLLH